MVATIRVVSIEEAKTAIAMLEAYLVAHGEEVTTEVVETPTPNPTTKAKTATKTEKASEPVEEKKTVKKAPVTKKPKDVTSSALTLAAITAKAKEIRGKTSTADVKKVIAEFTTGKLSTIKEEDYEAFITALETLVA